MKEINLESPFSSDIRQTNEVFEISCFFIPNNKNNREVCISCNLRLPEKYYPNENNIVCLGLAKSPKERYNILLNAKEDLESLGYVVDFKTLRKNNSSCPYNKSNFYEDYKKEINPLLDEKSPLFAREKGNLLFSSFPEISMSSISDAKNIYFVLYRKEKWLCFWNGEKEAISEEDLKEFLITKASKLKIDQEIIDKIKQL